MITRTFFSVQYSSIAFRLRPHSPLERDGRDILGLVIYPDLGHTGPADPLYLFRPLQRFTSKTACRVDHFLLSYKIDAQEVRRIDAALVGCRRSVVLIDVSTMVSADQLSTTTPSYCPRRLFSIASWRLSPTSSFAVETEGADRRHEYIYRYSQSAGKKTMEAYWEK